jgi:hypothetical protein
MAPDLATLLAIGEWGLAVVVFIFFGFFVLVCWFMIQATRAQLHWRRRAERGDIDAIQMMVADDVERWKTMKMPKGDQPSTWRSVQTAELLEVSPTSVRVSALTEGQYSTVSGERREVSNAFREAQKVTTKLADMLLYDIPNVRLPEVRIDVYSTYRDEAGSSQRCIMTTTCTREVAVGLDWDEDDPADIVAAFGARYRLDDRGNALPIVVDSPAPNSIPAAFYKDE